MKLDVVAVPRRLGVVLAAVTAVEERPGGPFLQVVAEDGARFVLPEERVLVRTTAHVPADGAAPDAQLRALRVRVEPFREWLALHTRLGGTGRLRIDEVAERAGVRGQDALLRVALGLERASPWFRRNDAALVAVPLQHALLELYAQNEKRFVAAGDEELLAWWPRRAEGVPAAWRSPGGAVVDTALLVNERSRWFEADYVPDRAIAGAAALSALAAHALGGAGTPDARGAELARRTGEGDDPDLVLEALVASGALPERVDPSPARAGLTRDRERPVLEEALQLAAVPRDTSAREDFTASHAVAVDDPDTREVDDAVSVRRDGDHVELCVHIGDVAAAVPCDGALDADVRARASSLYVPDGAVLLFPPELVLRRLALSVDEPRDALTGVFRLDAEGTVHAARFVRSRLRLARRAAYDATTDVAQLAADAAHGELLVRVAEQLRAARERRGARILQLPTTKVELVDGAPHVSLRHQDTPGDRVVSEAMVLFNAQAAEALAAAHAPAVYRGQGAEAPAGRAAPEKDDPLFAARVRRTFARIETAAEPLGHAGLGVGAYAQCTSPMRRYGDLVNQRQLAAVLAGAPLPYNATEIEALLPHLAERERAVRRAADDRAWFWIVRALADSGRTTLEGLLSRTPRRAPGAVWVPELCRELPLRPPRDGRSPPEGTRGTYRIASLRPWLGRIELTVAE